MDYRILRRRIGLAALALVVSATMMTTELGSFVFRKVWQSHYPELAARWDNNGRFSVIGLYGTFNLGDELAYATRVRQAAQSWIPKDPFIKNSQNIRFWAFDGLQYILMGLMQRFTGDVSWTWVWVKFICASAWFILVYRLTLASSDSPPVAVFSGIFITCFSYLLLNLFLTDMDWHGGFLHALLHNGWSFVSYGRTEGVLRAPRPALNYAILFLASLFLIKTAETERYRWAVISGVLGGLQAYVRFDSWALYMVAAVVFAAVHAWRRKFCPPLVLSVGISTAISLPWIYLNHSPDQDVLARMHSFMGPHVNWIALFYLAAFGAFARYKKKPAHLFMASVLAATAVMLNMQLVTGTGFARFYWIGPGNIFLFMLMTSLIPEPLRKARSFWAWVGGSTLLFAFLQGIAYSAIHYPFQGLPKDYADALDWLNKNTPEDSVVAALNPEANLLVAAFTHDKLTTAYADPVSSYIPTLENASRLERTLDLFGADRDKFLNDCCRNFPTHDRRAVMRGKVEMQDAHHYYFYLLQPEDVVSALERAARNPSMPPLEADYLWFGTFERKYAGKDFPRLSGSHLVPAYQNPSVVLYKNEKS